MNKNIMMAATLIIVTMVFLCIFAYEIIIRPVPQQTLEQVASAYLSAVQQQDIHTLNRLCLPDNSDCNDDMPNRLKLYTGLTLQDIRISYHPTLNSFYWGVRIRAKGKNDKNQTIDINDSFSIKKLIKTLQYPSSYKTSGGILPSHQKIPIPFPEHPLASPRPHPQHTPTHAHTHRNHIQNQALDSIEGFHTKYDSKVKEYVFSEGLPPLQTSPLSSSDQLAKR